jgi:hypothetical protein
MRDVSFQRAVQRHGQGVARRCLSRRRDGRDSGSGGPFRLPGVRRPLSRQMLQKAGQLLVAAGGLVPNPARAPRGH